MNRSPQQMSTNAAISSMVSDQGIILSGLLLASLTGAPGSTCEVVKNPALTMIRVTLFDCATKLKLLSHEFLHHGPVFPISHIPAGRTFRTGGFRHTVP